MKEDFIKQFVASFYKAKGDNVPLLVCFMEQSEKDPEKLSVQNAFTGDYEHGIVFLSSIITNLSLIYGKSGKNILLDIADDLVATGEPTQTVQEVPKKKKLEVLTPEEDDDDKPKPTDE